MVSLLGALLLVSCSDPLRDGVIESLGDEDPAFPPSEIHRPGQPCVACHSTYEGAEPAISIGGTLFTDPKAAGEEGPRLVPNHIIRIIDSAGEIRTTRTNRCGNFYWTLDDFDPAFPLRAELFRPNDTAGEPDVPIDVMASRIGRDGSCGSCHARPLSPQSPDVVFVPDALLNPDVVLPEVGECPPPRFAPNLFDPEAAE